MNEDDGGRNEAKRNKYVFQVGGGFSKSRGGEDGLES